MVEEVLELLAAPASAKGIELALLLPTSVPTWVVGDPGRLRQILMHLVANGVKFTDTGEVSGRITCALEDAEAALLRFEVADTGIGIAPEAQAHLFEVFSQAELSTTRKYGGTGLGLAICQRLTELLGGEIGVDSTPGLGSTFWFTVRLKKSTAALPTSRTAASKPPGIRLLDAANHTPNQSEAGSLHTTSAPLPLVSGTQPRLDEVPSEVRAHVLLAEDNVVNQRIAVRLLEKLGCRVHTVASGSEALAALAHTDYDLVLMDCQMPDMDGYVATTTIRAREAATGMHIPIIAMTANAMQGDRDRCLQAGMDDYVNKPVKSEQLLEMLRKWALPAATEVEQC